MGRSEVTLATASAPGQGLQWNGLAGRWVCVLLETPRQGQCPY